MLRSRFPVRAGHLAAFVALLFGLFALAPSAGANHEEFGVCHATGSESNPFVYISPDQSSGHLNTDESPVGPSHDDDRAATEAEFEDRACEGQTEFPTETPVTETPVTVTPVTETPVTVTPETPVDLPDTGAGSADDSSGSGMTILLGIAATALVAGAISLQLTSTRTR